MKCNVFGLIIFLIICNLLPTHAQKVLWAQQVAGDDFGQGYGIAVDDNGNTFVTGIFAGTAHLGSTTLTSKGDNDIFIAKYDKEGNLQWAKQAGGLKDDGGHKIAVDRKGNIYVAGYYGNEMDFGTTKVTGQKYENRFIAKLSPVGELIWINSMKGHLFLITQDLAIDNSGYCYLTGLFGDSAEIGTQTLKSGSKDFNIFIAKYDSDGHLIRAAKAAKIDDQFYLASMATDAFNNIYLAGHFTGNVTFGNTTLRSKGDFDIFIVKYNPSGDVLWAKQAGGTKGNMCTGIAVDAKNRIYITERTDSIAEFGSVVLEKSGAYIAKYDTDGYVLWAKRAGGDEKARSSEIAIDPTGNIYTMGQFDATATFGTTTLPFSGLLDIFVAKYDAGGNLVWVQKVGGESNDVSYGMTVDARGNCYVTGFFSKELHIGETSLLSSGLVDGFTIKLGNNP